MTYIDKIEWIEVESNYCNVPQYGNILVSTNGKDINSGIANVYWHDGNQGWYIETFDSLVIEFPYKFTHFVKI